MGIDKSFKEFIVLHAKKAIKTDITDLENSIKSFSNTYNESVYAIDESQNEEIQQNIDGILENIKNIKKLLIKKKLYEIGK